MMIKIGFSIVCFFISLVFLAMSLSAFLLDDWKGERGKEVKEYMLMRLLFSIAFSLLGIVPLFIQKF